MNNNKRVSKLQTCFLINIFSGGKTISGLFDISDLQSRTFQTEWKMKIPPSFNDEKMAGLQLSP